jgi:hypothetical protein
MAFGLVRVICFLPFDAGRTFFVLPAFFSWFAPVLKEFLMKHLREVLFSAVFVSFLALSACGGGGGSSGHDETPVDPTPVDPTPVDPTPVEPVTLSLSPETAVIKAGENLTLTATVSRGGVNWQTDGGAALNANGAAAVFSAATSGIHTVTATAAEDTSQSAATRVTVMTDPANAATLTFTEIKPEGASKVTVRGIDAASGKVFGNHADSNGQHGFVWDGSAYAIVDHPDGAETEVRGIDAAGRIFGNYLGSDGTRHTFVKDGDHFASIAPPNATGDVVCYGVDASGKAYGRHEVSSGGTRGFVKDGDSYVIIDPPGASVVYVRGIDASGKVFGEYKDASDWHGFVTADGGATYTLVDPPGATDLYVRGIDASGRVFGDFSDGSSISSEGFVKDGANYATLFHPEGASTLIGGVDAQGRVFGHRLDLGVNKVVYRVFMWDNGTFTTIDVPGIESAQALGVNALGQVWVGGSDSAVSNTRGFVVR